MVGQNIIVNGTVKSHRDNSTQLSRVKLVWHWIVTVV
jgi:hypothetical protein